MPRTAANSTARTRAHTAVRRTKTYVGCWTCRSRGVKCDATRPVCHRCTRFNRCCEGYAIRLLWDNDGATDGHDTRPKRRLISFAEHIPNPVLTEADLNAALKRLDSARLDNQLEVFEGPYSVFAYTSTIQAKTNLPTDNTLSSEEDTLCLASTKNALKPEVCYPTPQDLLLRRLPHFLSISSAEERRLLRFWVTSASGLLISTNHPGNPFREVVIPLVLESAASTHKLPGHLALLHSVYAFAALNRSQCQNPPDEQDAAIAAKHHQEALRYLRQSMEDPSGQHEAILASIILMTSIDIVAPRSGQWRIHLRGGREWLTSLRGTWNNDKGGNILRQLFHCIEIIGYSHDQYTQFEDSSSTFFAAEWEMDIISTATPDSSENVYSLDTFYGITKPVLRAIFDISRLSMTKQTPTNEELMALQHKLLLANPSTSRFPSSLGILEKVTRHHACSWYYACMIHYERTLHRSPTQEVQYLVEQCLYHLEATETLLKDSTEEGLMWPLFVTACEAKDEELRQRCTKLFSNKADKGIGSCSSVEALVLEIWHRRDTSLKDDVLRQNVMEDLGVDILFT